MTSVELRHGSATDVGRVREHNEDALLVAPPVFVVADGMGGHDHGDVASGLAIDAFAELAATSYDAAGAVEAVSATLSGIHSRIDEYDATQHAAGNLLFSAGTTAVVAVLVEDAEEPCWVLANLGDSRIYRHAEGTLEQVTVDHSLVQELVDAGTIAQGEAADHPDRHIVTRALGGPVRYEADFYSVPAVVGERLMLCTDGVSEMLDDAEIERILGGNADPDAAAGAVVAAAVAAGGRDNATAVVVDVVGLGQDKQHDSAERRSREQETGAPL
jgi:protein phosphatase